MIRFIVILFLFVTVMLRIYKMVNSEDNIIVVHLKHVLTFKGYKLKLKPNTNFLLFEGVRKRKF